MKKWLLLLLLGGCSFQAKPMMTMATYQKVHAGMSEEVLVQKYGRPEKIYQRKDGSLVYEYRERISIGATDQYVVEERKYLFTIDKNGKVVAKQMVLKNQPAYDPTSELNPGEGEGF